MEGFMLNPNRTIVSIKIMWFGGEGNIFKKETSFEIKKKGG